MNNLMKIVLVIAAGVIGYLAFKNRDALKLGGS